jgi:cytochrome c1
MPNYDWMSAQELNDMAAYLASIKHTKKELRKNARAILPNL